MKPVQNPSPFSEEIRNGLSTQKKRVSSKYLYDKKGSDLFVEITKLDEYYPAQCEKNIFVNQSPAITQAVSESTNTVIELGCGDGFKTEILLKAMTQRFSNLTYIPIDIAASAITAIASRIQGALPEIQLEGYCGDYLTYLQENPADKNAKGKLILFLGSNIGNFSFDQSVAFLKSIAKIMGPEDSLLIGMDLKKDIHVMNRAYNDEKGVTAAFNFNLLDRINRELGGHFDPDTFYHHGVYNVEIGAMQSFLVSKIEQRISIDNLDLIVDFDKLEPIHIENSCKYSIRNLQSISKTAGFEITQTFTDSKGYFVDSLWRKRP